MANQILKDARLWIGAYNFSGDANALAFEHQAEMQDDTSLEDSARSRLAGLKSVALQCEGMWNSGAAGGGFIEELLEQVGLQDVPATVCPIAGAAEGDRAFTFLAAHADYQRGGTVGELFRFSAGAQGRGVPLVRGELLHNATRTVTGNGGARQLGALTAAQKLYASLHVLTVSGTNPSLTVVVQSASDQAFTTPNARITFGAKTAAAHDWSSVAGAVSDTWWRVNYTISGTTPSFLFVVAAGIL